MFLFELIFCSVYLLGVVNGQTADEIANNPNNFHMFENFVHTKNVYVNETKIVSKLKAVQEILLQRKKLVQDLLESKKLKKLELASKSEEIRHIKSQLEAWQEGFPGQLDFQGALGGLVRLQFAYEFNLKTLTKHGIVKYKDFNGFTRQFNCHERLSGSDYVTMGLRASEIYTVGTAMDFLKEGLRLAKIETGPRKMSDQQINSLKTSARRMATLNNGYLTKRKNFLDRDFIIKPFLVTETLERKKKQPKFIQNMTDFPEGLYEGLPFDHYFMEICRNGRKYDQKFKSKEVNCRFLHHADPYLKLGPFKEEQKSERPYAVVFHDILTETEMDFLIEESTPNLSRGRYENQDVVQVDYKHELKDGKKVKIVHKTVQAWLEELEYPKDYFTYVGNNYTAVKYPILMTLSQKIQLATQFKTLGQYSATPIQVTNYGLGGLCEAHIDPHGYIEGKELSRGREGLQKYSRI